MNKTRLQKTKVWSGSLLALLLGLMLFLVPDICAQTLNLSPVTPTSFVKLGDGEEFELRITNPSTGTTYTGAYLDITIPAEWKYISARKKLDVVSSPVTATDQGGGVWRIEGLDLPNNNSTTSVFVKLVPLCDAQNGVDIVRYKLLNSTDTEIASIETNSLVGIQVPTLQLTPPTDMVTSMNSINLRTWDITQNAALVYINGAKVEIVCANTILLDKVEYSTNDGANWTELAPTNISAYTNGKYTYTIPATAFTDGKLDAGEKIMLRETLRNSSCTGSPSMIYQLYYGNGEDWCAYGGTMPANLSIIPTAYVHSEIAVYNRTIPKASDGSANGKIIYTIRNNSSDANAIFRDFKFRGYVNGVASQPYMKFVKAYFVSGTALVDADKISGTPEIYMSTNTAIPNGDGLTGNLIGGAERVYVVDFSKKADGTSMGDISALVSAMTDAGGDGVSDDLKPNSTIYLAIEYYFDYNFTPPSFDNNNLGTFAYYYSTYYKDNCGKYVQGSVDPSGWGQLSNLHVNRALNLWRPSLSQLNIRSGDNVDLSVRIPDRSSSGREGWMTQVAVNANYNNEHWIYITLPDGLRLDPDAQLTGTADTKIKINTGIVDGDDVVPTHTDALGVRSFKFRNRVYNFNNAITPKIPLIAVSEAVSNKDMYIYFSFNFVGETVDPYPYGGMTVPLDYNFVEDCDCIGLTDYVSERRSFGYTDETMNALADRNTHGINLQAAGPFDDVTHIAYVSVNKNVDLGAMGKLKAKIDYKGNYFSIPNTDKALVVRYRDASAALGTWNYNDTLSDTYITNVGNTLEADLTSLVSGGSIVLDNGAVIEIEFLTRTVKALPAVQAKKTFEMSVYTENSVTNCDVCTSLINEFTLWNYRLTNHRTISSTYNANGTTNLIILHLEIGNSASSQPQVFVNEFRPNSIFSNSVYELNGLYQVDNLTIISYYNQSSVSGIIPSSVYTVSYSDNKTIISIPNTPGMPGYIASENYSSYGYGYSIKLVGRYIGAETSNRRTYTMDIVDYPTSATPQLSFYQSNAHTLATTWNFYKYALNTLSANAQPLGSTAEWKLSISNTSNWAASDPKLPHSWLALDCAAGILGDNVELWDAAGTAKLGDFTKVEDGKYWIHLRDNMLVDAAAGDFLTVSASTSYTIKSNYVACSGTHDITATYGMSNVTYPSTPWKGYDDGDQAQYPWTNGVDYETPRVYNTITSTLTLTPPASAYTYQVELLTSEQDIYGIYNFCTPFTVDATYYNALPTELNNLRIGIELRPGIKLDNTFEPIVFVNDGGSQPYDGYISYNIAGDSAYINLNPSFMMSAVGDSIKVRFKLKTACGFQPGKGVMLDISATEGCGARQNHIASTPIINVGGGTTPFVQVTSGVINSQNALGGIASVAYKTTEPANLTVEAEYNWILFPSNALTAFIDFPADAEFVSGTLTRLGTVYNASFTEVTQSDPTIKRIKASFQTLTVADLDSPVLFKAVVNLKLNEPSRWTCGIEETIRVWAGVSTEFTCEGFVCDILSIATDSDVRFMVDKLTLDYNNVVATGKYHNATQERVTFTGSISNANLEAYPGGSVKVELYLDNDGDGTLSAGDMVATNAPSFDVSGLSGNSDVDFNETFNIRTAEVCKLMMVMRKSENIYLCEDLVFPISSLNYETSDLSYSVCSESSVVIGDVAVSGYIYEWLPATNLSDANIAQPSFTAPIVATDTDYDYELIVTRPGGCSSSVNISVTALSNPVVNSVSDFNYCSGELVPSYNFTGTPAGTVFNWECISPASTDFGLSATSGTGSLPSFTAINNTSSKLEATYQVTPSFVSSSGTCSGTPVSFKIEVHPKPVLAGQAMPSVCPNATIDLSQGVVVVAGMTVKYYDINQLEIAGGASTITAPATPGNYTYYAKATVTATGCESDFRSITVT
ncbi:hypothetical protein LJC11_03890, partial [Bacteroidales bacterium OttesenSCG-928-I21]|nr:hypothetical protein [Bacteroidales bacterium OttesenSCG-928-I21]